MPPIVMEPDRFQKLCQALLVAEYPGLSASPSDKPTGVETHFEKTNPLTKPLAIK